ncbi:UDP-N-acetylmuramate dehydrogenase [Flavobacteriaceae bacterium]|jgi:UDP-N-acetylmuramate dehydrogenase|nr:UDP-N-acetylmuramate dehydrogenase [Flavobacteriaceae bacterium]MDC3329377.1 UDP-N-acetylmuramate dehydrogenase [Flavobacteriaceae bacterium]
MMERHFSLKNYNSFGIEVETEFFAAISDEAELIEVLKSNGNKPFRVLGGGSNVLLTEDYKGLTLVMQNKGISILEETASHVLIEVQAGENWHELVLWALENDFGGIENLALIPGSVGAAPIQNIGAYGVELSSVFHRCKALDLESLSFNEFDKAACEFGYRSSVFKTHLKGKAIITRVQFKLSKKTHQTHTQYGALQASLQGKEISIQNIAASVIAIRKSKLPDPAQIGNSGSFFKNPVIPVNQFKQLQENYPEIPHYPDTAEKIKIPAGWLIEKLGYKGKRFGDAGVHEKQALVLVNYGNAKGVELLNLAQQIQEQVLQNFGVQLEVEVNIF